MEQVTADPDPRLSIPSCRVPAHLFSSARGRWCWGGWWGLPPGCSGTCNRPPHPGMSSTRWPPLQSEGTWLQSHQDQKKLGDQPHMHTHMGQGPWETHRTQLCFSQYLSSALPPSGSGGGTCCSSLSCCRFPRPGSERSPGCSHTPPGSPGQRGGIVRRQPTGSKGGHRLQKAELERQRCILTAVPGQGQKGESLRTRS